MSDAAITIAVADDQRVSGLLRIPPKATACYVMAHGAGAGMSHEFLASMADALAGFRIATLRFQFPYMQRGRRRPDSPAVAHATVRAAVAEAARYCGRLPLFAGGKSFGARMTSQAQAARPIAGLRGLVFLGFPLHPPRRPSTDRAEHLSEVHLPMLFLQGTRDEFAKLELLTPVCRNLGQRATLETFDDADHSFHVRARSGRTDGEVRTALANAIAAWIGGVQTTILGG
ncbi:MAG TPA: alpha/beta family hydrolase [Candidatus Binatia bacterium]|nr:alpha/beta family hydrolase [Candidatus Binatia bacterium]